MKDHWMFYYAAPPSLSPTHEPIIVCLCVMYLRMCVRVGPLLGLMPVTKAPPVSGRSFLTLYQTILRGGTKSDDQKVSQIFYCIGKGNLFICVVSIKISIRKH